MRYQEKDDRQNRAKNHSLGPSGTEKSREEEQQLRRPLETMETMTVFHLTMDLTVLLCQSSTPSCFKLPLVRSKFTFFPLKDFCYFLNDSFLMFKKKI